MEDKLKEPSVYDKIFWLIEDKKIRTDYLFLFRELFWPCFIQVHGYIFIKENFDQIYYENLINNHKSRVEYWINLVTIDGFFSEDSDWEKKSPELFCRSMATIWRAKLKQEFPELTFTVEEFFDEEDGECGLTFYQEV